MPRPHRRSRHDESRDSRRSSRTRQRGVPLAGARARSELGAQEAEVDARLPGDELLDDADVVATRAITIEAPPSAVWPWIAQMGPAPRGGAYTYDWIENLFGLHMHSADRVLSEFQHPTPGDTIGVGKNPMRIEEVEPERVFATRSANGNWVWTFVLQDRDGQTRLISRNRFRLPTPRLPNRDGTDDPRLAGHGTEDVARHQGTRGAAGSGTLGGFTHLVRD